MNNRLHNCNNLWQGAAKRVLCVCSAGLLRSPTAAIVLNREFGWNTRAVGLDVGYALIPIDIVHIKWADEIVCMDADQKMNLELMCERQDFSPPLIHNMDIPDNYVWMDAELQEVIMTFFKPKGEEDA